MRSREEAVRIMVDWFLSKPAWQLYYGPHLIVKWEEAMARQWKCQGILMHFTRGCETGSLYKREVSQALIEAGFPVLSFEADQADIRQFDATRIYGAIDSFLESLGYKKLQD